MMFQTVDFCKPKVWPMSVFLFLISLLS
uniref:Uncharacterized protein n=1 Tax=Anguilla anguilla TaxID=7936 RepID=A0A0E9VXG5_ANGAN